MSERREPGRRRVVFAWAPFWAERLGKAEIRAYQVSARGGEMVCRLRGERVEPEGACRFYLAGEAEV